MKLRDRRNPADFEIVLTSDTERFTPHVLDISIRGLRIRQSGMALEPEDDVGVEINELCYPSRITWVKDAEAGLEFDQPLPPDIYALIARPKPSWKRWFGQAG